MPGQRLSTRNTGSNSYEPFAGIDPVTVQSIQVIIRQLASNGIAILITDHAAREILQITDRTYVVSEGRILVSGSSDQIVQNEIVRAKYLGDISFANEANPSETSQNQRSDQTHLQKPGTIRFTSRSEKPAKVKLKSTDLD